MVKLCQIIDSMDRDLKEPIQNKINEAKDKYQKELVDSTKEDIILGKLNSLEGKSLEKQEKILEEILEIVKGMSREPKEIIE